MKQVPEQLKKMSTEELVLLERHILDEYDISEPFDFAYLLQDFTLAFHILVEIREKNPVPPDSDSFMGITENDKNTFCRVAELCKIAAQLLDDQRKLDQFGYVEK